MQVNAQMLLLSYFVAVYSPKKEIDYDSARPYADLPNG